MIPAKNTIIVKIQKSNDFESEYQQDSNPEYAILNPVSGSFDLLDDNEYRHLQSIISNEETATDSINDEFTASLLERGYIFKTEEAQTEAIDKAYREFQDEIGKSQVQLMLVPTYSCNLACTYCYQGRGSDNELSVPVNAGNTPNLITRETVDAFFDYAKANFPQSTVKPFITLFGGEPLVNSPAQRNIISYILDRCAEEQYEFSAVTNGYDFVEYVDLLGKVKVKEIQFTLDGSRQTHDTRRATANKKGTFDKVVAGIEAAIGNGMPVNLRSVVDLENIEDIVNLAEFLDRKGWLDLPPELFKTQIGRNYELFDCYAKPQHLMTQVELWGKFASLSKQYPVLAKFHRPDFKGIRHLVDTGEMYMASFDTCPACKTEWVFDLNGSIYGCTASCGREEYLLGTFWPKVDLNNSAIDTWKHRDVKSISKCRDCRYDVICGGGCGVVAANKAGGKVLSPDCRPIHELLETGINHYIDDIRRLSDGEDTQKQATNVSPSVKIRLPKSRFPNK
ncbi:MAG: radical SAM protein [Clostridiales bacterium]|nr:radical SAM protein [Clostridiales bacterium]